MEQKDMADKFTELISTGKPKEVRSMCQAIDKIEENAIEKGIISLVEAMQELGQTNEAILQPLYSVLFGVLNVRCTI